MTHLTDCNCIQDPYLDSEVNFHSTTPSLFRRNVSNIFKIKNSTLFTIIFVAFGQVCWGQNIGDYGSVSTGNWNASTTWRKWNGTSFATAVSNFPGLGDNAYIANNNVVTLSTTTTVNNIYIQRGSTLNAFGKTLNVYGNFLNDGTFTPAAIYNSNSVYMMGSVPQNIGGSSKTGFYNLIISNQIANGVTADANFSIYKTMTINAGCSFKPEYNIVISGVSTSDVITGEGTVKVTSTIGGEGDYSNQYPSFSANTVNTIEYIGLAVQVVTPATDIINLIINNASGCILYGEATMTNLNISSGTLSVAPGAILRVGNITTLSTAECLVLHSDEFLTGSYIHSDNIVGSGTVKIERYMSHSNNWHLYCSPIGNQSIKNFLKNNLEIPALYTTPSPGTYIGDGMRDYNTSADQWNTYFTYETTSTDATSMSNGKGFSIRTIKDYNSIPGTGTLDAVGNPNPNNVVISLSRTTATTDNGWNLIGNPYTCALNIQGLSGFGFLTDANIANIDPGFTAVYVWDTNNLTGTSSNTPEYVAINNASDQITNVQMGQGFFVKSIIGGGKISLKADMQIADALSTFKGAKLQWPSIKIFAKSQTLSSTTQIKFITNTTKGLDVGYDAGMLKANPGFALYSKLLIDNAVDFTIQCLPDQNYDQYVIPIGIDCKTAGDITFTAETVNLPVGCQALLEDRLTKRFTRLDLKDAKYTATLSADTKGTGRFFLHTSDVISGDQPIEKEPFKISKIGKTLYINGEISDKANFFVYSVNGKQLANFKAESQVQNQFDASGLPAGVYILTADDQNQKKSTKFVIEN